VLDQIKWWRSRRRTAPARGWRNSNDPRDALLLPHDADLVRRDPALPGLAIVLDPEALAATLPGVPLGGLRIAYVRYRPGKNCLVAYRPALASSGETWIPASVHAVAWRRKLWDRARPARAAEATGIFLDDWAVSVSLYPDDAELPSLRLLVDADERPRALRSVLPDRPDFWSAPLGDLRHKPQQRYVGKLMPPGGPAVVLKIYGERYYQDARAAASAFAAAESLGLNPLLGQSDAHRTLAFAWIQGQTLSETIADQGIAGASPVDAASAAGAALAELHRQVPNGLPRRTREKAVAELRALAVDLAAFCPHLGRWAAGLAGRLVTHLAGAPVLTCAIHGDFDASQVVLRNGAARIIDLDHAALGDPAHDLGRFGAHLTTAALHGDLTDDTADMVTATLVDAYERSSAYRVADRIDLHTAIGIFHRLHEPFRSHVPDWPERTEAMLARVQAILDRPKQRLAYPVS